MVIAKVVRKLEDFERIFQIILERKLHFVHRAWAKSNFSWLLSKTFWKENDTLLKRFVFRKIENNHIKVQIIQYFQSIIFYQIKIKNVNRRNLICSYPLQGEASAHSSITFKFNAGATCALLQGVRSLPSPSFLFFTIFKSSFWALERPIQL